MLRDGSTQLDLGDAWRTLEHLLGRLRAVGHRADWLVECLDALVAQLGADRGLVLLHRGGADHVVEARGRKGALPSAERLAVSRSVLRRARLEGAPVVWELGDDEGGSESLASFGIVAAVAFPLREVGGERAVGALYLDFRHPRWTIGGSALDLLAAVADAIAVVLERDRSLREARHALVDARRNVAGLTLDEVLAPPSMAAVRAELATLGDELPLLVTGEPGTGKTLLCQALAEASRRRPVVRATLGASDDVNTIASELFGHERGAFSGALGRRVGLVEQAHGGILVLDEILSLPLHAQQLLLDLTQFGTFRPLGFAGREPKHTDVRILAATNGDLDAAVREGRFRTDLFHRLAGVHLRLPPLRERRDELEALALGMLARLDPERGWSLAPEARAWLLHPSHAWPGNLRELSMRVRRARERALAEDAETDRLERAHLEGPSASLDLSELHGASALEPSTPAPAADRASWDVLRERRSELDADERRLLEALMIAHDHNVSRVARELGLARTSLISRLESLGIERPPGRRGRPR